jgi:leucyl/phenylalanyl-tRNA--protein transferase
LPYFELSKSENNFPPAYFADNDGLLAVGGELSAEQLLKAYKSGVYFWNHPLKHVKWWSPDPRIVIDIPNFDFGIEPYTDPDYRITFNQNFTAVINTCKQCYNIKEVMDNRWLTERMDRVYHELHQSGYAHSAEVWQDEDLVAGIIGIAIGKIFFVEYLFSSVKNGDVFALESLLQALNKREFILADMQKASLFMEEFSFDEISRLSYLDICKTNSEEFSREKTIF